MGCSFADPKATVWLAGAYFRMMHTYTQGGQVWLTDYKPEIIGPAIVEQSTSGGMLMPYFRHPTLGARRSPRSALATRAGYEKMDVSLTVVPG